MKIINPGKRLDMFWGEVDKKHISIIQGFLSGKNVLDMGCGYGTTTAQITAAGYNCTGIDYDDGAINEAKKRFPHCKFQSANAETLPFEDGYFDVIILRDALHHFYSEANFEKVKSEMLRVSKKGSRIIFFDPNVNFLLKIMRKISAHVDEECDFETATQIMKELDLTIIHSAFNTIYSLPLSGGYVGINFVPPIRVVQSGILFTEKIFENIINRLHLGRYLCWRYAIVGER
jgi:ubiquinone/menaquinone biosynthesis C-methylase UbiE